MVKHEVNMFIKKKTCSNNEDNFKIIGIFERFNVWQIELVVIITDNGKTLSKHVHKKKTCSKNEDITLK